MKNRLSNNRSHELYLFQDLVARLRELEGLGGLDRLHAEFWGQTAVSLTIRNPESGVPNGYTIYMDPLVVPLRVTYGEGGGPQQLKPFKKTRAFLNHVIAEVEEQIMWAREDLENWEKTAEYLAEHIDFLDERDEEPEEFTEVNVGGSPGGFIIYE